MKNHRKYDLFQEIQEELEKADLEISHLEEQFSPKEVRNRTISAKKPRIIIANNSQDKDKDTQNRQISKEEVIVAIIQGVYESRESIVEAIKTFKEMKEVDREIEAIRSELFKHMSSMQSRIEEIKNKSDVLKQYIQLLETKINFIIKLVEGIPSNTEEDFQKKLQLIEKSNQILEKLSHFLLKFLTI